MRVDLGRCKPHMPSNAELDFVRTIPRTFGGKAQWRTLPRRHLRAFLSPEAHQREFSRKYRLKLWLNLVSLKINRQKIQNLSIKLFSKRTVNITLHYILHYWHIISPAS